VGKVLGVDALKPRNQLVCKHEDSLKRESAVAQVEEPGERWPAKIECNEIEVEILAMIAKTWNAYTASEGPIRFDLAFKEFESFYRFEFDGKLFSSNIILANMQDSE
jgi:hypothetical protein